LENGIVEDVLIENCDFGLSHGTITLGSECIHSKDIIIRDCKVDTDSPILRLKLRPDTPQLYENISLENISGDCGVIISARPWKQFFDLKGRLDPPYAVVRNITFKNVNVTCKRIGELIGNPKDVFQNVLFQDCNISTIEEEGFNTIYTNVLRFENVRVNGTLFDGKY
jgi:polygalacturonase